MQTDDVHAMIDTLFHLQQSAVEEADAQSAVDGEGLARLFVAMFTKDTGGKVHRIFGGLYPALLRRLTTAEPHSSLELVLCHLQSQLLSRLKVAADRAALWTCLLEYGEQQQQEQSMVNKSYLRVLLATLEAPQPRGAAHKTALVTVGEPERLAQLLRRTLQRDVQLDSLAVAAAFLRRAPAAVSRIRLLEMVCGADSRLKLLDQLHFAARFLDCSFFERDVLLPAMAVCLRAKSPVERDAARMFLARAVHARALPLVDKCSSSDSGASPALLFDTQLVQVGYRAEPSHQ